MIRAWQRNARIFFGHRVKRNGEGSDTKRLVEANTVATPFLIFSLSLKRCWRFPVVECGATNWPINSHNACQKTEPDGAAMQAT